MGGYIPQPAYGPPGDMGMIGTKSFRKVFYKFADIDERHAHRPLGLLICKKSLQIHAGNQL